MTPTDDLDFDLLERHFAGDTTAEEDDRLGRWLAAAPARREVVASLERVWRSNGSLPRTWNIAAMWGQLTDRIRAEERSRAVASRPRSAHPLGEYIAARPRWYRRVLPAAAAALLIASAAMVWQFVPRTTPEARTAPTTMREFATARGERAEIRLADATRVLLGPATTLRISAEFGGAARDVHLDGEAFFEVTHDARRPFNVHAGGAVARDLGTKFTVSAYRGTGGVQVVVAEGLVALQPKTMPSLPGTLLRPRDLGRVTSTGETAVIRGVDLGRYLDWTTGRLVFDDIPLRDALPRIERWYDVTIALADSTLFERRLTATFKDQPIGQVLDALALLLGPKSFTASGRALHARSDSVRAPS